MEITVTNEDRNRLLTDAHLKYFNVNTSVQAWLGVKVDLTQNTFLGRVGAGRVHVGNGLRLVVGQVEDAQGNAVFLPIYPCEVGGQFLIPSSLILHPNSVPSAVSTFVVTVEEIRIVDGKRKLI